MNQRVKKIWFLVSNRIKINQILSFWFGPSKGEDLPSADHRRAWWIKDEGNDRKIREHFENDLKLAIEGDYDQWKLTPEGSLGFDYITGSVLT